MVKGELKNLLYIYLSIGFFIISLAIYIIGITGEAANREKLMKRQEEIRMFYGELENEIKIKAGNVIASNNIEPLVYNTILRMTINLPFSEIEEYTYDKNILEVKVTQRENIVNIKELIKYGEITQEGERFKIRVD